MPITPGTVSLTTCMYASVTILIIIIIVIKADDKLAVQTNLFKTISLTKFTPEHKKN